MAPAHGHKEVFSVFDRKVKVEGEEDEQASVYTLCRRWVQNDPGQDDSAPVPQRLGVQLPPAERQPEPEPVGPAPAEEPLHRQGGEGAPRPATDELMAHHMGHWRRVRKHHSQASEVCAERDRQRLMALLPRPDVPAVHPGLAMMVPPQQQQQQQQQQGNAPPAVAGAGQPFVPMQQQQQGQQQQPMPGGATAAAAAAAFALQQQQQPQGAPGAAASTAAAGTVDLQQLMAGGATGGETQQAVPPQQQEGGAAPMAVDG